MDEKQLFEITTRMEKDDYKKYLYFTTFRKSSQTVISLLILIVIGTFFFSFLLKQNTLAGILIIFVLMALLILSFLFLRMDRQARKLFPVSGNSSFKKEQTIRLYETCLTASNRMSDGETLTNYESFHEIYETAEYLILYFDKTLASPVRKKDIPAEERTKILAFLKEKLNDRYTVLS